MAGSAHQGDALGWVNGRAFGPRCQCQEILSHTLGIGPRPPAAALGQFFASPSSSASGRAQRRNWAAGIAQVSHLGEIGWAWRA